MSNVPNVLVACAMSAAVLVTPYQASQAQVAGGAVQFRPHRAVYDITFDHATPGSGVADMTGRRAASAMARPRTFAMQA